MHPEIESALTCAGSAFPTPNELALKNAEKLLNYIGDINLERTGVFVPTVSQGIYMLWNIKEWEFHLECTKEGSIHYSFRKRGKEEANGLSPIGQFIPQLEKYLLIGVE